MRDARNRVKINKKRFFNMKVNAFVKSIIDPCGDACVFFGQ